jgi:multidrug efflux pump subunit AcrB
MKLQLRAPSGTRIEETEKLVEQVERRIRELIPAKELETLNDMIGTPTLYNLAFVQTENIGGMDTEILISLKSGHEPTAQYRRKLRAALSAQFPGSHFHLQPADIVTQVLNFGLYRADRRADRGGGPEPLLLVRPQGARCHACHPRDGRRAPQPGARLPDAAY